MKRKEHIDGEKHCSKCDSWHPLESFHKHARNWDGLYPYCKSCCKKAHQERYSKNKDRLLKQSAEYRKNNPEARKNTRLKSKYGIDLSEYQRLLDKQSGVCAICEDRSDDLCVDHCHDTGSVRGLLCRQCNAAIGMLGDNAAGLRQALRYLS